MCLWCDVSGTYQVSHAVHVVEHEGECYNHLGREEEPLGQVKALDEVQVVGEVSGHDVQPNHQAVEGCNHNQLSHSALSTGQLQMPPMN